MAGLDTSRYKPTTHSALSANGMNAIAKDIQLENGPEDSISDIAWSPFMDHLAVSSWDSKLRIYDVTTKPSGIGKALVDFNGPVLSCCWSKDGQKVVGAGTDKTARLLDLGADGAVPQQVAVHDEPIKSIGFFQNTISSGPILVTGSWDKTVKFWDLRQATPVGSIACKEKVYSLDTCGNSLVIATAEREIHFVDLQKPTTIHETILSPLKHQTRVIKYLADEAAIAVGSIEGRVAVNWTAKNRSYENYTFRCHRNYPNRNKDDPNIYAVNALAPHPSKNICATAGADGAFNFWDLKAKTRFGHYDDLGGSITAAAFNKDASAFAYAISYDWSQGYVKNRTDYPTKVMLHTVLEDDVKPKVGRR